jgi:lysyl-tRNA synthetase class 1
LPELAANLSDAQKKALGALAKDLEIEFSTNGEMMHALIRSIPLRPTIAIDPKEFFVALYTIFLAKESGPQAGWFLAALPKDFVVGRLKEASE